LSNETNLVGVQGTFFL